MPYGPAYGGGGGAYSPAYAGAPNLLSAPEDILQERLNKRLRGRITRAGGQAPEEGSQGLIARIFDILSRPNYAIANTVQSLSHLGESEGGNPLEEFWQGLAGEDKTTFGDVIGDEWGVTGQDLWSKAARGVGGFALDVGLDPTTYLSGFTSVGRNVGRATGRAAAARAGVKASVDEVLSPDTARAISSGLARLPAAAKKAKSRQKLIDTIISDRSVEAGEAARSAAIPANRNRVGLRFAGRELGSTDLPARMQEAFFGAREIEGVRAGGTAVGRAIADSGPVRALGDTFRNANLAPHGLSSVRNVETGKTVWMLEQLAERFKKKLPKGITTPELESLALHAERGVLPPGASPELEQAFNEFRDILDQVYQLKDSYGLTGPRVDNFVPVHTKGGSSINERNFRAIRKVPDSLIDPATGQLKAGTSYDFAGSGIERAEDLGLKPIKRADHILAHELADLFGKLAEARIHRRAVQEFGVDVTDIADTLASTTATAAEKAAARQQLRVLDNTPGWVRHTNAKVGVDSYFPEAFVGNLKKLNEFKVNAPSVKHFLNMYDKIHSYWKAGATIINPGHHIRNAVGDIYMNWVDDVNDPRVYAFSMAALGEGATGQNLRAKLANVAGLRRNRAGTPIMRIGGRDIDVFQAKLAYADRGLHSSFFRSEFGFAEGFGSQRGLEGLRELSAGREEWGRLAHFVSAGRQEAARLMRKKGTRSLTTAEMDHAWDLAGERVRKWNFDYNDITPTERAVGRRATSFYTFMRKNLPAQIEALLLRPGKSAAVPKSIEAIQQFAGTDDWSDDISNRVPDWLREGANPIVGGSPDNPTYLGLDLPLQEALGRFGFLDPTTYASPEQKVQSAFQELFQLAAPAVKLPAELATGRSVFTGAENPDLITHLLQQLPLGRQVASVVNPEEASTNPTSNLVGPGGFNFGANWLWGTGLQQATDERQLGELKRQEDVLRAILLQLGIE